MPSVASPPDDVADVRLRLERYARSKDPRHLWPRLVGGEPARMAAARELERVTRLVLAGGRGVPIAGESEDQAYALGIAGHTTGMGPLVGLWIEDGMVHARPNVAQVFARHLAHNRRRVERLATEVLPAIDALVARGITPVVLKGLHTAHTYFQEPGVRRMNDVDLLVPRDRLAEVEALLQHLGYTFGDEPVCRYKRDWIAPGVDPALYSVELSDARSTWVLEIHTSLDRTYQPGAVARLDRARLTLEPFALAGRALLAPAPQLLLLLLACHCSDELEGARLSRLVEIISVIRAGCAAGRLDWDEHLALLRRTNAARFAYPAYALSERLAPRSVDPRVLALGRGQSTWAARHTVERLTPAGGSLDARGALRQFMWARGPAAVLHNLRAALTGQRRFTGPADVLPGWRVRLRRLRAGSLTLRAPDERV